MATMAASPVIGSFVAADYAVFALMLLVSAAIGVYYAIVGRGQSSSREFLMGGQSMTAIPVALSLTASFMSTITVLATPAKVYRYGANYGLFSLYYVLVVVVSSEVFLPVFYRLGITSTYEVRINPPC